MKHGVITANDILQQDHWSPFYDREIIWNQTVADSGQWLSAFRECIASREILRFLGMGLESLGDMKSYICTYSTNQNLSLKIFPVAKSEVAMRNKVIFLGRGCGSLKTCNQGFTTSPVF
jgi:hypothetical protein